MKNEIEKAKELIKECVKFNVLESWDGKVKVFFQPDDKEQEPHWCWISIDAAAKDLAKQNAFDVLEKALKEAKEIWVDSETLRTDTEMYADLLKQAEEHCKESFPALYETVFGGSDDFFLYYDGSYFTVYYYNPDSNSGGQIVECTFNDEMAKRILEGESFTNVLAEREQYLYDIDTISFFNKLKALSKSLYDNNFIGNAKNEDELSVLVDQTIRIKAAILRKNS